MMKQECLTSESYRNAKLLMEAYARKIKQNKPITDKPKPLYDMTTGKIIQYV